MVEVPIALIKNIARYEKWMIRSFDQSIKVPPNTIINNIFFPTLKFLVINMHEENYILILWIDLWS